MSSAPGSDQLRGLKLAIVVYLVLFVLKLAAYAMTAVLALLAEALHTLSDIFISGFLLVAAWYSRRKADEQHMFGHGRAQNVAALVAATLFLSFTSLRLYEEAIPRLFSAEPASYQNLPLALGVLLVSMIAAAAPLVTLLREQQRGAVARAQLLELINDELGVLAALIGTLLVLWGQPLADPIAALVVATIIAVNAIGLFRDNLSFLLGRSPGPEYLAKLERQARSVEGVLGVHELRAEYVGPDTVHAGMHLEVRPELSVREADQISENVRRLVHDTTDSGYCVIQVESAQSDGVAAAGRPTSPVPA